jgi:TPR repeat protein
VEAQNNLGVIYSEGQGIAKDYVQAYFWFNVAAKQGDKNAARVRDTLAKDMNISQVAEAIQLTHEWQLTSGH